MAKETTKDWGYRYKDRMGKRKIESPKTRILIKVKGPENVIAMNQAY